MAPRKTPPAVLEGYHNVKKATEKLGLSDPGDPDDKTGQRWLRDGVNLKGWPHVRLNGQLMFSDSDLAAIVEINRSVANLRGRRPRRRAAVKSAA